jgi:signal transduction histidine kinase
MRDVLVHAEQRRYDFRQKAGISRRSRGDVDAARAKADLPKVSEVARDLAPAERARLTKAVEQDSASLRAVLDELDEYKQALQSRATIGLLVGEVLHEGRRHLGDISARARTLLEGADFSAESSVRGDVFRRQLGSNASAIARAASKLNRLFRMLDPVSGRKRGKATDFSVRQILNQCFGLLSERYSSAGIKVTIQPADVDYFVNGYEDDVHTAVLNVLDNAIHWLELSTAPSRRIAARLGKEMGRVTISLSNNGVPLDETYADQLFDVGFTLKSEGTGLGLAIAREALRRSGGEILYEKGTDMTTFKIVMPASGDD